MARLQSGIVHGGGQQLQIVKRLAEVLDDLGDREIDGSLVSILVDSKLAVEVGTLVFCRRYGLARVEGPFWLKEDWEKDPAQLSQAVREQDVTVDDSRLVIPQLSGNPKYDWRIPGWYMLVWFRQPCTTTAARLRFQQMGFVPGGLRSLAAFIAWWPKERECHILAVGGDSYLAGNIVPEFCNFKSFPVFRRELGVVKPDVVSDLWSAYLVRIRPAPEM